MCLPTVTDAGEAINPKHLSLWERVVCKWQTHYDPVMDAQHKQVQIEHQMGLHAHGASRSATRMTVVRPEKTALHH